MLVLKLLLWFWSAQVVFAGLLLSWYGLGKLRRAHAVLVEG
jgi:hypothetical protein